MTNVSVIGKDTHAILEEARGWINSGKWKNSSYKLEHYSHFSATTRTLTNMTALRGMCLMGTTVIS